jgi:hypothetical protein
VSKDNHETVYSYPMYTRLRDGSPHGQGLAARSSASGQLGTQRTLHVVNDPGEFRNRIDDTGLAGIVRELTSLADRQFAQ